MGAPPPYTSPDGNDARIFLAPLGRGNRLPGPAVRVPETLAVAREEAEVAVLHQPGSPAGRRIVIVVVEDVAEARDRLLVAVAEIEPEDLDAGAVGLHARGETANVDMTVIALRTRVAQRRKAEHRLRAAIRHRVVGAADTERTTAAIGEERAGIALAEIPAAVGTERHRVQRVIVIATIEPGQQHFALVDRGSNFRSLFTSV